MDSQLARRKLDISFNAQNLRKVNTTILSRPADLDLSKVPTDLADALRGVQRTTTNWSRIGEQIAVLRDGLNQHGNYLSSVYLGARNKALKMVVVCGFGGPPPLGSDFFRRQFEFTWTIVQSLEDHIQQFDINPQLLALLDAARQKYLRTTNPVVTAAVDLAWSMINAAKASGGPSAAYLAVCSGGISPALGQELRNGRFQPAQAGFGVEPMLDGVAWDNRAAAFDPNSLYFGRLEGFDDHLFKQAMRV